MVKNSRSAIFLKFRQKLQKLGSNLLCRSCLLHRFLYQPLDGPQFAIICRYLEPLYGAPRPDAGVPVSESGRQRAGVALLAPAAPQRRRAAPRRSRGAAASGWAP